MKLPWRFLAGLLVAVALAAPARAAGVFEASIQIALPPVLPPLYVVEPGVQVVEELDEEVFFANGWYWVRRDARWYRARDTRHRWIFVEPRFVPSGLRRIPPGHYRHFRHADWEEKRRHEREKERRHEIHQGEKERRREIHEAERIDRDEHRRHEEERRREEERDHRR
jgi:hypothetical protein